MAFAQLYPLPLLAPRRPVECGKHSVACRARDPVRAIQRPEGSEPESQEAREQQEAKVLKAVLPKTGLFALEDTKKEVYARSLPSFDPAKRGGRYTSDFIWNTDWQKALQIEESLQRKRQAAAAAAASSAAVAPQQASDAASEAGSNLSSRRAAGTVSFSRLAELNSMDVDLTEMLVRRNKGEEEQQVSGTGAAVNSSLYFQGKGKEQQQQRTSVPLPRNDVKRLERGARATRQVLVEVSSSSPEDEKLKAQIQAQELANYEADKAGQRLWTAALSAIGVAATYSVYGREVCASYLVGALGGIFYLRLLGKSVDKYGGQVNILDGASSALGNQRLLIPVILALGYNRWNELYADEYGLRLNLLAMLVGFLTYKVAVIARQAKQVMDDMSNSPKR